MKSALYVFEGPDGVGKTTLALKLREDLRALGRNCEVFAFPGKEAGTLGELIHRLYHNPKCFGILDMSNVAEQLLFTAAHVDVIQSRIRPALQRGSDVILDRYWWSTWVYGAMSGLGPRIQELLLDLELSVLNEIKPTCMFLVRRDRPENSEHTPENWAALLGLYAHIARDEAKNYEIIGVENNGDISETSRFVREAALKVGGADL